MFCTIKDLHFNINKHKWCQCHQFIWEQEAMRPSVLNVFISVSKEGCSFEKCHHSMHLRRRGGILEQGGHENLICYELHCGIRYTWRQSLVTISCHWYRENTGKSSLSIWGFKAWSLHAWKNKTCCPQPSHLQPVNLIPSTWKDALIK